ncbi:MAG: hypothetical protein D6714_00600 [Bacteroidetes bacterium]|nr:MAG: hypothetical protein D6714_00600 [Bacteroidota bacterium]
MRPIQPLWHFSVKPEKNEAQNYTSKPKMEIKPGIIFRLGFRFQTAANLAYFNKFAPVFTGRA